jgi:ectoine hydroxylase-related dioxygenase (phytanoyl-CoA dioxygenase family)
MPAARTFPPLLSCNHALDPAHIAFMSDATDLLKDAPALRERLEEQGYLLLRGVLDKDHVADARRAMLQRLADEDILETDQHDLMEGILRPGAALGWRADLARDNPAVERVVYDGAMMDIFRALLAGPVRHFDYTWVRAIPPGPATQPHCDIVYMGRGTRELYTAWTPIGDAPLELGGLMILEDSHRHPRLHETYCRRDVDAVCTNRPAPNPDARFVPRGNNGRISSNPVQLRRTLGGRWLIEDFFAGDVVIFRTDLVHGGLDNRTADRLRLSTDTRYQSANQPVDERWIGADPPAHGPRAKRHMIC